MVLMMKMTLKNQDESDNGQGDNSDANQNDDDADEKNDFNNFGDQKQMMKKTLIKMVKVNQMMMTLLKKKIKMVKQLIMLKWRW